jgi:hypothetical protein
VVNKKKILVLSDESAADEGVDSNVIDTVIKLKTNKDLPSEIEIFAEVFDPSNRYSLQTLNIAGIVVANEMVALYISNLLAHPLETKLYEDLLMTNENGTGKIDFDIRQAKEILDFKGEFVFNSKAELTESIYKASGKKILPIGMVGLKERKSLIEGITGAVTSVVNVVGDVASKVGNALTLSDSPVDSPIDQSDVVIFNHNLHKKQKITLKEDTILILVNIA